MSVNKDIKRVTTHVLQEMKSRGEKITMLTAYDFSMARILDEAGVDILLVGDSASNVMAGHETTLPITLDQMIYHGASVVRAVRRALIVVDLPLDQEKALNLTLNKTVGDWDEEKLVSLLQEFDKPDVVGGNVDGYGGDAGCVPPSTAASASTVVRAMLLKGSCAVRLQPLVWQCVRNARLFLSFAPTSCNSFAQSKRPARILATSMKRSMPMPQKKLRRPANSSTSMPAAMPVRTYSMPSASV